MTDSKKNAPVIENENIIIVEGTEVPVVAIDNTNRKPTTKADNLYGFPTVANPAKVVKIAVGLISAMRLIVQPVLDDNQEVVKQGIMLLTITKGTDIFTGTIGTAYLGAIEGLVGKDGLGKSIRYAYEICKLGVTTYEDADGLHFHGVNGNRITELNPMDTASYMEYLLAEQRSIDIDMIMTGAKAGVDMSAVVAYLKG